MKYPGDAVFGKKVWIFMSGAEIPHSAGLRSDRKQTPLIHEMKGLFFTLLASHFYDFCRPGSDRESFIYADKFERTQNCQRRKIPATINTPAHTRRFPLERRVRVTNMANEKSVEVTI
jgi:hypothetical protein